MSFYCPKQPYTKGGRQGILLNTELNDLRSILDIDVFAAYGDSKL